METVSATDEERLPPGGFSLRHGFPCWFRRAQRSLPNSRDVSGTALVRSIRVAPENAASDHVTTASIDVAPGPKNGSMVRVLEYIRSTFNDASVLDALPLEAAANPGAYHAWRTYRGLTSQTRLSSPTSPRSHANDGDKATAEDSTLGRNRRPGAWNWDGVWEDRVRKAVKASHSESVLYGTNATEDIVRALQPNFSTIITHYMIDTLL